jgi:hypothetical protein
LAGKAGNGELRPNWRENIDEKTGCVYYWDEVTGDVAWSPPMTQLDTFLAYLCDRIGVPRDMGSGATLEL